MKCLFLNSITSIECTAKSYYETALRALAIAFCVFCANFVFADSLPGQVARPAITNREIQNAISALPSQEQEYAESIVSSLTDNRTKSIGQMWQPKIDSLATVFVRYAKENSSDCIQHALVDVADSLLEMPLDLDGGIKPTSQEIKNHIQVIFRLASLPFSTKCHLINDRDVDRAKQLSIVAFSAYGRNDPIESDTDSRRNTSLSLLGNLTTSMLKRGRSSDASTLAYHALQKSDFISPKSIADFEEEIKLLQIGLIANDATLIHFLSETIKNANYNFLQAATPDDITRVYDGLRTTALLLENNGFNEDAKSFIDLILAHVNGATAGNEVIASNANFAYGAISACSGNFSTAGPYLNKSVAVLHEAFPFAEAAARMATAKLEIEENSASEPEVLEQLRRGEAALAKWKSSADPSNSQLISSVSEPLETELLSVRGRFLLKQKRFDDAVSAFYQLIPLLSKTSTLPQSDYQVAIVRILIDAGAITQAVAALASIGNGIPPRTGNESQDANPIYYTLIAEKLDILLRSGNIRAANVLATSVIASDASDSAHLALFNTDITDLLVGMVLDPFGEDQTEGKPIWKLTANENGAIYKAKIFSAALLPFVSSDPASGNDLFGIIQGVGATSLDKTIALASLSQIDPSTEHDAIYKSLLNDESINDSYRIRQGWRQGRVPPSFPLIHSDPYDSPCAPGFSKIWNDSVRHIQEEDYYSPMLTSPDQSTHNDHLRQLVAMHPDARAKFAVGIPATLDEVRHAMGSGTAIVLFTVFSDYLIETFVGADEIRFARVNVTSEQLDALTSQAIASAERTVVPYDASVADRLSDLLLSSFTDSLGRYTHLIFIPSGPLTRFPFALLRVQRGQTNDESSRHWLIDDRSISVSPGLGALVALSLSAKAGDPGAPLSAPVHLVGFGAPLLQGSPPTCLHEPMGDLRSIKGIADVDQLRSLCRIDDTGDLLANLDSDFNGNSSKGVYIGTDATKANIIKMSNDGKLSNIQLLIFATHALSSASDGIGPQTALPGLVFTPPAIGTRADDGYLTLLDIAKLRISADWILLVACDTAASDGTISSTGLSGFAQAFIFSGGRELLVSNWSINQSATRDLIYETVQGYINGGGRVSKSEALRRAMVNMRDRGGKFQLPYYWAAFTTVGR
ncbi:CHAT domain-containing protein [Burkholderia pseudomallei]|uniref:CHAT domain-containing protein n=1 Tax=Burkholderia pseudomallei TaxID=28450 RepID=UPI0029338A2A|nr:CHAT domain-containing protein [Burkholderia pseudomallei]MDV2172218.1 CHAT domain-containing protein [Burkholderia pseudomallei]MDV2213412.1 CHAT domain-containing protein [Burkholderia pseudomallei]